MPIGYWLLAVGYSLLGCRSPANPEAILSSFASNLTKKQVFESSPAESVWSTKQKSYKMRRLPRRATTRA